MPQPSFLQTNNTGKFQADARFSDSINIPWFIAPSPKNATATAPGCEYCADSAQPVAVGPSAPTIPEEAAHSFPTRRSSDLHGGVHDPPPPVAQRPGIRIGSTP